MSAAPPPMPDKFPLPAVYNHLAPYIRTATHTHQTRQLLAAHQAALAGQPRVASASGSDEEFARFLDLELPRAPGASPGGDGDGGGDNGVRRQYLTALRQHAQARREHAAAQQAVHDATTPASTATNTAAAADDDDDDDDYDGPDDGGDASDGEHEGAEPAGGWMEAYLRTLRIRRQLNRLAVLREGVAALADGIATPPSPPLPSHSLPNSQSGSAAGPSDGVARDLARAHPHPVPPVPEPLQMLLQARAATSATTATGPSKDELLEDALVLRLQKRIVAACHELSLPACPPQPEDRAGGGGGSDGAMQAVHDALVAWLTDAVSAPQAAVDGQSSQPTASSAGGSGTSSGDSGGVGGSGSGDCESNNDSADEMAARIEQAYAGYLDARRELLTALLEAEADGADEESSQPPIIDVQAPPAAVRALLDTQRLDVLTSSPRAFPPPQVLRVLAAAEHLLPLARAHRCLLAAHNHHASLVARARARCADAVAIADTGAVTDTSADPVAAAHARGEQAVRAMALAEKTTMEHVHAALARLQEARCTADAVGALCAGGGAPTKNPVRAIPVRASAATAATTDRDGGGGGKGVWAGLSGGVGVIGDGI